MAFYIKFQKFVHNNKSTGTQLSQRGERFLGKETHALE